MKSSDSGLHFIDCNEEQHAAAILAILNDAIVNSTALYDYVPRPPEAMVSWFATKRANGFPVVGVIDDSGTLMGFASWGTFRAFPARSEEHTSELQSREKLVCRLLLEKK